MWSARIMWIGRLLALWLLAGVLLAQGEPAYRKLGWSDLTVKIDFEDPFEDLTTEQLMLLSIVARVEAIQERAPENVSEGMLAEAGKARETLRGQEVDIEGLFAAREDIKRMRRKRATATNPHLKGVRVSLPGYALPLAFQEKGVTEFLLVPWVGACIHTPPPPPNQIVFVTAEEPLVMKSRFQPVVIEGVLIAGEMERELFLVDGTGRIPMSYSMENAAVREYAPGK